MRGDQAASEMLEPYFDRFQKLQEEIRMHLSRIEGVSDRLFGSGPSAAEKRIETSSLVEEHFTFLNAVADRLKEQSSKLERLTGANNQLQSLPGYQGRAG